jgi:ribosomal protein S10
MKIKLILTTIPARNLPLQLTNQKPSTIINQKGPITINRSPHIDKKSREQFKIYTKRNIIYQTVNKREYSKIQTLLEVLKKQYILLRITLFILTTERFISNF